LAYVIFFQAKQQTPPPLPTTNIFNLTQNKKIISYIILQFNYYENISTLISLKKSRLLKVINFKFIKKTIPACCPELSDVCTGRCCRDAMGEEKSRLTLQLQAVAADLDSAREHIATKNKDNLKVGHRKTNWRIDNLFDGPSEMTLCLTKGRNLRFVIRHNVIWAN